MTVLYKSRNEDELELEVKYGNLNVDNTNQHFRSQLLHLNLASCIHASSTHPLNQTKTLPGHKHPGQALS